MATNRALITGITGQDGAYLSKLLLEKGYEVFGMVRKGGQGNSWRLEELGLREKITFIDGDLRDEQSLTLALRDIHPDEIYNLAAKSSVGTSFDNPLDTSDINAMGTLRLLTAMRTVCPSARFFQASTSAMFGNATTENGKGGRKTQDESTPFHPQSPYAVSKLFAHWMTINFRECHGLYACCGILFNHESPLRGLEFVTRKITDGVARVKLGLTDSITLGNLDSVRDFGFAGDYVEAMWLMLQLTKPDDFVIATGESHSVRDVLDAAFREIGIDDWSPYVRQDPSLLRPVDTNAFRGNSAKAEKLLKWKPKVSFHELVKMMVQLDLKRLDV